MRAARVTAFDQPLHPRKVPVPVAGPGQVLIRVEAGDLCRTGIRTASGDRPVKPVLPPGHEGVSRVERLGARVTERALGERVAVPWLGWLG